jgi:hypothetical protein
MSIALDTALYLREQKSSDPLTLEERGVLFTLMFRVGSNPFTWISQESLAIELDVSLRQLKRHLKSLIKKSYLEEMDDPKDKRKNLYRPAEFLINYHQQQERKPTKSYPQKPKKKVTYMTPNSERKVTYMTPNSERKVTYMTPNFEKSDLQLIDPRNKSRLIHRPKEKLLNKKYINNRGAFVDNFEKQKQELEISYPINEYQRQNGIKAIADIMKNLKIGATL